MLISKNSRKGLVKILNELSIIFQSEAFQVSETLSSTFGMIKSTLEGNFEFLHPVSQQVENLKPTKKNVWATFYIHLCIIFGNSV